MDSAEHNYKPYAQRRITKTIPKRLLIGVAACILGGVVLHDWRYLVVAAVGALVIGCVLLARRWNSKRHGPPLDQ